jgi:hypothetical protein
MDNYGRSAFVVVQETRERFIERPVQVAKLMPIDLGRVDVFAYTPEKFEKVRERENPSRITRVSWLHRQSFIKLTSQRMLHRL